ncbi:MAG: dihydrofolate reductase family protein [Candidatus Kapabacteria bacterium]|nr:dihydrofolate reductase family protein [Candidatus Kapabacteria bacterium]
MARKLILYTACSLDCFIAGQNNELDWLMDGNENADFGYKEFYSSISTTISGYKTYSVTLGFGQFPYPGKENFIFSRNHENNEGHPAIFIKEDPVEFVKKLKLLEGGDIWLVGGGQINGLLIDADLIDEMILFYVPVVLGQGIPLFQGNQQTRKLELTDSFIYDGGMVKLVYKKINY